MPRVKYTITCVDEFHATFYLSDRIRNHGFKFSNSVSYALAESDFRTAVVETTQTKRAAAVNSWCETYLSVADWRKVKSAVRKRRERWRRSEEIKTITISAKAHKLLTQICSRDHVTFSQGLEHYLAKALNSARGRAGDRPAR